MALKRTAELKAEMQSRGVRLEPRTGEDAPARKGGAGPAEGITLLLDGSPASVPFSSGFVSDSPFRLKRLEGRWTLFRDGTEVDVRPALLPVPSFYGKKTREGVPLRKIALFHGADCLASTVLQACTHWGGASGCGFCGIGLSLKSGRTVLKKTPEQLAEAALAARKDGVRHVTLTAGSTADGRLERELFESSARAVVRATGLPVHVQLMPTVSREQMEALRDAGVASLGIHRETFNEALLKRIAPCKAAIPEDRFLHAWQDAVRVFGRGQVSSFLLMGMGESRSDLIRGCRRLADLGVYPYLVPFRPIPGTPMADHGTPDPAFVREVYEQAAGILEESGLDWAAVRAGCVRCRGCSALPDYQDALAGEKSRLEPPGDLAWEVVRGGSFLEASFAIRHEVFVEEQGLFRETDRDERDTDSLHIVARMGSRCVGTVRITALEDGMWLGSRLAVRGARRGHTGRRLVDRAEEEVFQRGGRTFVAYIQLSRVPFFEKCGWRCVERVTDYHGKPHVLMTAAGSRWMHEPGVSPAEKSQARTAIL